jgi:predicted transcriptional regulator
MAFADMPDEVLDRTAQIVSAHLSRNAVPMSDIPNVIATVYQALINIEGAARPAPEAELVPAVPIKRSVFQDYIICLEDGKKLKMLKRHLKTVYGMTPDQYRRRWGLPSNYPMVAPAYAERRSTLAKSIGLGSGRARERLLAAPAEAAELDDDLLDDVAEVEDDDADAPVQTALADDIETEDDAAEDAIEPTAESVFSRFTGGSHDAADEPDAPSRHGKEPGEKPAGKKRLGRPPGRATVGAKRGPKRR